MAKADDYTGVPHCAVCHHPVQRGGGQFVRHPNGTSALVCGPACANTFRARPA
jgi:hypothetical protein